MRTGPIIVADDDGDICLLLHYALAAHGYNVLEVHDGGEALKALESTDALALITDLQMPRLDGIGLVSALRQARRTEQLPVIVVTGLPPDEPRVRAMGRNAGVHLLFKPFSPKELRALLADVLQEAARITGYSAPRTAGAS